MKCGVATRCINPERPIRMAGYASRDKDSEGAYQDLNLKALALGDGNATVVIVTSDILYFDDDVIGPVEVELARNPGIPPDRLFITASHTHCGPVTRRGDRNMYGWRDEEYLDQIRQKLVESVREAVAEMVPCTLTYHRGRCGFNINRRVKTPSGVQMRPNPDGAVDRDVDILCTRTNGQIAAILFGYCCHPTTMGGYLLGGDYPGFAQIGIESALPGTTALFVQGCSGNVRPNNVDETGNFKSGPLEVVQKYGEELADAVLNVVAEPGEAIEGKLRTGTRILELPLMPHPSRADLARATDDSSPFRRRWAWRMLDAYNRELPLPKTCPVHVQTLQIGKTLSLVAVAGEVCVEIGLGIKSMIGEGPRFVLGYTNRVIGYIPSKAIHADGGYEVDGWYFYENMPSYLAADAEDIIVGAVGEMLAE
ncbi:MAG TPA: neutral/alkaline non-lysosomal ceramidase N-terminal domain-containing protein [Candidatus Latescibacteria bacterium]|nr:neutral/alkaline non-lysosomal ceramidase N-terminal domain-containing protein [Candidatus Latescibacterota bacterium]HOS64784.1 neutral/alkaline non-lysosomal ceramidase N-terminal domain-containing protein [Candidatus Latescibacterota bacterium]HPK73548.1 neutral/alkaline non-lysosomal ceramidase N-terminal domain-containing protein [Candidatus Latescibacterota bacterium]